MLQPKPVRKHKEESLKPKQQRTLNYLLPTQSSCKTLYFLLRARSKLSTTHSQTSKLLTRCTLQTRLPYSKRECRMREAGELLRTKKRKLNNAALRGGGATGMRLYTEAARRGEKDKRSERRWLLGFCWPREQALNRGNRVPAAFGCPRH